MKTLKFTNVVFSSILTGLLFFSCSKDGDQGPIGPQGPQGEQGLSGADGQDGEQGPEGETGTANVIYSNWINTELENSIAASAASFTIDAPEIDPDMLNFGTILVYGRRLEFGAGGNLVYQLPITFGAARQQSYYFTALSDTIRITVAALQQGENVGDGSFLEQYRYILIPGGVSTSGKSAIDLEKMTYEEVLAHFNIPK